ncbi:HIT family protein, partial [Candidatus Pacearchaeota archaeon CG_4_10_14_0_2_um_filter_05_32_18]
MPEDCIFCKFVSGKIKVDFIYESDNFFAFADANPKVKGHTLIIPKKHFVNSMDFPDSLASELFEAIKAVAKIRLKEGFEGFNLVQNNFEAAGQKVMHTHFHILPRKKGDG